MAELDLVMPMAGRGSRFAKQGFHMPKPLVPLAGKPFYAWAVESVASKATVRDMVFVVLREHVDAYAIDRDILARYPAARLVVIDDVTSGAAETASIGIAALDADRPLAINDCDHAFDATGLAATVDALAAGDCAATLLGFRSANPGFSYVRFDGDTATGRVTGTIEKQVASPFAIAGCYLFGARGLFDAFYERYRRDCPYPELFVSGIYNTLLEAGRPVGFQELRRHVPFGTPEELAAVDPDRLASVCEGG